MPKKGEVGVKSYKTAWKDEFYVKAHRYALDGYTNQEISRALGVSNATFLQWLKKKPALKEGLETARRTKDGKSITSFRDYVYERLPDELKELWDKINACDEETGSKKKHLSTRAIESLFASCGKMARMHLFLYAYVHHNFNASEACRCVNISWGTYRSWIEDEEGFAELVEEIHIHKKNMFESALIDLVRNGDPAATIFANRSINRDRGYNDKQEISISGSIEHNVRQVDELELPLEVRKAILESMRAKDVPKIGVRKELEGVEDAEYEEVKTETPLKRKKVMR